MSVTVETRYGRIRGTAQRGVQVYRGVPFAEPPLGPFRLRAPLPPRPWQGVLDCHSFGAPAPQNAPRRPSLCDPAPVSWSEDCLTLNVFTPRQDGAPRPVLVWVHGGDFVEGRASEPGLTGRALARWGDVVVVTLQYRLGALGFLDLGAVEDGRPGPANLGLLDQVAALEWVRDEIDVFGGDPSNVTVFGTCAGAGCAAALAAMPRARGLFRRAILQSPVLHLWDRARGAEVGRAFLRELDPAPAGIAELEEVPTPLLLAAQQRCERNLRSTAEGWVFRPVVDGEVLPSAPLSAVAAGEARGIPLIVGTNLDEARMAGAEDPASLWLGEVQLVQRCKALVGPERARLLIDTYRATRLGEAASPSSLWAAMESDRLFRHPAMRLAELQAERGESVFAYLFRWPSPVAGGALGAFRGLEVPFVFGTRRHHALRRFVGGEEEAKELSRRMREAWIEFARSGDPSGLGVGRWPAYAAPERRTLSLGTRPEVVEAPLDAERSFWDG